ncbi:Glycosyltransferase family 1 protein [Candidatus Magnetomoraceae bacterium gMMP-1]
MNIAIFSSSYLPEIGGIQFELFWLLKAIDNKFKSKGINRFFFIVPRYKNQKYLNFKNIEVIEYDNWISKKAMLSFIFKLSNITKYYSIDLLNSFAVIPEGFCCLCVKYLNGTPYIVTSQGADLAIDSRFNYGIRLIKYLSFLTKIIIKKVNCLVTISQDMVNFAIDAGAKKERIKIIPNGIELKKIDKTTLSSDVKNIKEKYLISDSNVVYLTLSGMRKIKGHLNLVKAFARAVKKNSNLRLFIGAHGDETENIKMLVQNLNIDNYVYFIGFVSGQEKEAWFNVAHVYCNSAYFEPFGIVYIEAIKSKIAVLGSIYGGGKDIFLHEESAHLINPESIEEIYQGILKLSESSYREKLIRNADSLLPLYDINRIADMYLNTYIQHTNKK